MPPGEVIAGLVLSIAAVALSIVGFSFSGYGSTHRPQPSAAFPCEELNLTLDGAVLGIINATILADITVDLQCAPNEALLGGVRYETGLWLEGECELIPSGNTTLPPINPALLACANEELLVLGQLRPRGLGFNGSCITPLLPSTIFGGDVTGVYNNLQLNPNVAAGTCGASDTLCDLAINAKGLVTFSTAGTSILFTNATAGGGATGPLNNLTLSLAGTTNQTTLVVYANGTAQLGTPQPICTACTPSFATLTLTGTPLAPPSGGTGVSSASPPAGSVLIGNTATSIYVLTSITGTTDQVTVTPGAGSITLSAPQDLATTSSVTFAGINTIVPIGSGGTGLSGTPTNGQFLIGTGAAYVRAGLTGTTNQVIVTPGAGSSTLSLPQSLATTSTPTFTGATLTVPLAIASGGTGTSTAPTSGQLLIGNGAGYTVAALTGTTNQVNVALGSGTTTISPPQIVAPNGSPTFSVLTLGTPLTAGNGGTGLSTTPTNGKLLIGNGAGFTLNAPTGTAGQITVTTGAGSIQLTLTDLVSVGTCGGDGNTCVYAVGIDGRILNYVNQSVVATTTVSGTTTGCYGRAYTFRFQKTIFSATFAAIDFMITQTGTGSTNSANCDVTFDAAVPATYRPPGTTLFTVNVLSGGVGALSAMIITSAGVVTIRAVQDQTGIPLAIPTFGYPVNYPTFALGDISVTYFTLAP